MRRLFTQSETRKALDRGLVANGNCETPGCVELPDGHPDAERVSSYLNRTGKQTLYLGAPWLLGAVFSVRTKKNGGGK